ncbi:MAG TPA: RagB/SusD family nutrient uptake outer membrane protein, partial [Chitinophagaceae bacterium]|nr:RagB/SusD family nutrient uptake outer membrane protein [Chitinophagaceae bacterium]
ASGRSYEKGYQNTGCFIEKYAPKQQYLTTGGTLELNYPYDYIEIRLADTYLMEAEALMHSSGNAARAQQLLDAVRTRVGLGSVPVTLATIYGERRLELATEGHRFFDLVRTDQAGSALSSTGFTVGKNEILPIPLTELNNTNLVQNTGY